MIELYTGTPGSGKSLHCAKEIYSRISHGKTVIANFDINMTVFKYNKRKKPGKFLYIDNSDLSPDYLMKLAVDTHRRTTSGHIKEGQTLLVIDECQILFNSRDWQAKDRMKWATFFTQHRKYGYNIILITQFYRLIDRQIRSLVEYQIIHRKISNFKTIGFFVGLLFGGNAFVAITQWYGLREKIDSQFFILRHKYARLYDSYRIFGAQTENGDGPARDPVEACAPEAAEPAKETDKTNVIKQNTIKSAISTMKHRKTAEAPEPQKFDSFEEFWFKQDSSAPPN